MTMERIRHIATTRTGTRVAVGSYETRVAVWDIKRGKQISEFDTVLDGVGDLAITPDGRFVVAGQYHAAGTGCYDAKTGDPLWVRKELKRLNSVEILPDGSRAWCAFSEGPGRAVDVATGETLETLRGARGVYAGTFDPVVYVEGTPQRIVNTDTGKILKQKWADVWTAAFAPGLVCLSGSIAYTPGSKVGDTWARWCVDVSTGEVVWRQSGKGNGGSGELGYDERAGVFVGLTSDRKNRNVKLVRFAARTGECVGTIALPGSLPEVGFVLGGSGMLSWDGRVIDTETGDVVNRLAFPDVANSNA